LHQPQALRFAAINDFCPENQPTGRRFAAYARQPLRASGPWYQTQTGLRLPEFGPVRGNPEVAGEREFKSTAERRSADFGNSYGAQFLDANNDPLKLPNDTDHLITTIVGLEAILDQLQVSASAEHIKGASNMQNGQTRLLLYPIQRTVEFPNQIVVKSVDWRAIENKSGDAVVDA